MPARERAVVEACCSSGEAPRRLARTLGISLSHVYRLHKQAIARIRRRLSA
ncbi:MAG: sigma factor-like helix-turn-helix DNA-binding protein [Armatimonadota bacterium]|nr:sigma factor-like helix-turn-helix DNA-binding protein [Armatimonadota bacterium]